MKFSENSKPENSSNSNSDSNYNQGRMGGNFPTPDRVDTRVDTSVDPPVDLSGREFPPQSVLAGFEF